MEVNDESINGMNIYTEENCTEDNTTCSSGGTEGITIEDKQPSYKFDQFFNLPFTMSNEDEEYLKFLYNIDNEPKEIIVKLSGDTAKYPFDKYFLNFLIGLPMQNLNIELDTDNIDSTVNSTMIPKSKSDILLNVYNVTQKLRTHCDDNDFKTIYLCPASSTKDKRNSTTFVNIEYTFERNYTILTIVIPLLAIFFLLGGIFIFENSMDNIGNRLALTLGIFALIFTLPKVIGSMKPLSIVPTIADSMLSLIILSTIAFTISSILSSSSIIQKWFPKHFNWIDYLVFGIVSGFVVLYFNNYLFDVEVWWLVPIMISGLGYGLLMKTLGFKINGPLKLKLFYRMKRT